jgi:hypothetical protein
MEGGLRLYRRGRKGWLEILGFAGQTGEDHMAHLRSMGQFLRRGWNQVVEPD